jgi:hypothetical protein
MTQIEAFNRALFLHINGGDGTPAWLIQAAIGIADDLIYLIPLLLAASGCGAIMRAGAWQLRRVWSRCSVWRPIRPSAHSGRTRGRS